MERVAPGVAQERLAHEQRRRLAEPAALQAAHRARRPARALVEFSWLRTHAGHENNERAHDLAYEARARALAAPDEASDSV
jgi:ribonuclease HI